MHKDFTIGYINHDQKVFERLLGPSLDNLEGSFDVINTSSENFSAKNYNEIIKNCKPPYAILTHQDVTFSKNLLESVKATMKAVNFNFGALGMVGVDEKRNYRWSKQNSIFELDTLDCCFMVIRTNNPIVFDEINFGEYHLYVEDYCAQLKRRLKQKIYTIMIPAKEEAPYANYDQFHGSFLNHHSNTIAKLGSAWGRYYEFRDVLEKKWPKIKTT